MPNWENYCMRKYGKGIKKEIEGSFKKFIKAYAVRDYAVELEKEWDRLLNEIPEDNFVEAG